MTATPPHSLESEAAVVGAVLIAPVVPRALAHVRAEDFYHEAYRLVFDAARRLWEKDTKVDPVTMAEELRASGEFDRVGFEP